MNQKHAHYICTQFIQIMWKDIISDLKEYLRLNLWFDTIDVDDASQCSHISEPYSYIGTYMRFHLRGEWCLCPFPFVLNGIFIFYTRLLYTIWCKCHELPASPSVDSSNNILAHWKIISFCFSLNIYPGGEHAYKNVHVFMSAWLVICGVFDYLLIDNSKHCTE